jgi:hypothetical protein
MAAALIGAVLSTMGCDTLEHLDRIHPRTGAPPIAPEVLAAVDTATFWVGGPLPARGVRGSIGILVLWNGFDPRCAAIMPMIEAWHEAYGRWGLRITGLHFAPYAFAGDSAVVGAAVRRLGVRFPTAVISRPPPAAVSAGRGPVIVWPGGGDSEPQWLQTPGDANAFEMRLRAKLRQVRPDAGFPADAGGVARGAVSPGAVRTLLLGVDRVTRGPLRGATAGRAQPFVSPFRSEQEGEPDTAVPVGWWVPRHDALEAARGGAANFLAIRYDAGPVGAVMGPPPGGAMDTGPARVWILQDERWLAAADASADVKFDARGASYVDVDAARLYALTRGGSHVLKLSPDVPGTVFYSFTLEAAAPRP